MGVLIAVDKTTRSLLATKSLAQTKSLSVFFCVEKTLHLFSVVTAYLSVKEHVFCPKKHKQNYKPFFVKVNLWIKKPRFSLGQE